MKLETTPLTRWIFKRGWLLLALAIYLIFLYKNVRDAKSAPGTQTENRTEHVAIEKPVIIKKPEILEDWYNINNISIGHRGSPENLINEIDLFAIAWDYIIRNSKDSNKVNWEKKLEKIQIKELPIMRKEYGELLDRALWEENIDVEVSGKLNKTITFIGGKFASNRNIKETQDAFTPPLKRYRFSRVRYKWYRGDDEYTYYDLSVEDDKDYFSLNPK